MKFSLALVAAFAASANAFAPASVEVSAWNFVDVNFVDVGNNYCVDDKMGSCQQNMVGIAALKIEISRSSMKLIMLS